MDEMSALITKSYEDGQIVHAIMVLFGDGYMVQATPGSKSILVETEVKFGLGRRDEFGIPDHDHADSKLSEVEADDILGLITQVSKKHGPPVFMGPAMVRKVGRFQAMLFGSPPMSYSGDPSYVVAAFGPSDPSQKLLSAEEAAALLKEGKSVPTPEHDHWFLSDKPVPLAAALWVFRSLTEENITATNCNCAPKERSISRAHGGMTGLSPRSVSSFVDDDEEEEPDEVYSGGLHMADDQENPRSDKPSGPPAEGLHREYFPS